MGHRSQYKPKCPKLCYKTSLNSSYFDLKADATTLSSITEEVAHVQTL